MNCPKCHARLRADQPEHCDECGWTEKQAPLSTERPSVPCERCGKPALVRLRTGERSWANFCIRCGEQHHRDEAERWCAERGLHTPEQRRAFIREQCTSKLAKPLARRFERQREPGDDDEALPA